MTGLSPSSPQDKFLTKLSASQVLGESDRRRIEKVMRFMERCRCHDVLRSFHLLLPGLVGPTRADMVRVRYLMGEFDESELERRLRVVAYSGALEFAFWMAGFYSLIWVFNFQVATLASITTALIIVSIGALSCYAVVRFMDTGFTRKIMLIRESMSAEDAC